MEFIERLDLLLKNHKIGKTQFLKDVGFSKNAYSEWNNGVTKSYMNKIDVIADYFNVSVDYLLGREDQQRPINDQDLEFALFGAESGITPEDLEEVKKFAEFVKSRKKLNNR